MPDDAVPLRNYIDTRFTDANRWTDDRFTAMQGQMDRRFEAQEKAMFAALVAARDALAAALAATEKAAEKADQESRDWQERSNEWRGAMNDRERSFLTRREFYGLIAGIVSVLGLTVTLLHV